MRMHALTAKTQTFPCIIWYKSSSHASAPANNFHHHIIRVWKWESLWWKRGKTNIHEGIQWLHGCSFSSHCLFFAISLSISDYMSGTLTCSEWNCHFASLAAVSPAFPQVQWSRPCSRVMAELCFVGHWSSPPLRGDSTSLFSSTGVTSHLQASCADWEVWVWLWTVWIPCCRLKQTVCVHLHLLFLFIYLASPVLFL